MEEKNFYFFGKIVSKYSFKGEVVLKINTEFPSDYDLLEKIFIKVDGSFIPYFISKITSHSKNNSIRILFDGISDEQQVKNILQKKAYIPLTDLPKLPKNKFYIHEIIGFNAVDKVAGIVGKVININEDSPQKKLVVNYNGKEVFIPLVDEIVRKIDKQKNEVLITMPNGLLNLN